MTQVKINNSTYSAIVFGRLKDAEWDNRESKSIKLTMTYDVAKNTFINNTPWSIIQDEDEYDNSEFCIAGDITDHRDGTITVKMGKPTELESALMMLL